MEVIKRFGDFRFKILLISSLCWKTLNMKVIDTHLMFPLKVNIEIRVFFQFFSYTARISCNYIKGEIPCIGWKLKCMFILLGSILENGNRISVCLRQFWFCIAGRRAFVDILFFSHIPSYESQTNFIIIKNLYLVSSSSVWLGAF